MGRPNLLISAPKELFASFFPAPLQKRMGKMFLWRRSEARKLSPQLKRLLSEADALITTWDSPRFGEDLPAMAPRLRMIAHCGGEVKSRFDPTTFEQLTITNAADPMARATGEMGATLLLYSARNVDFYRAELKKPSNRIYDKVHAKGTSDAVTGQTIAMIGFGRIGRALVDCMRGFDIEWIVHDPYVPRSLQRTYPVRFVTLGKLLPRARYLVLTAALTEQTRGLLGKTNLANLPDGATVINIARGALIDLDALRKEVRRGRLRCAIDVTDPLEPLPVNDPLRNMSGAIVTPHIAGSGGRVREEIARVVLNDLERFFRGERVRNRVTTEMLERMT